MNRKIWPLIPTDILKKLKKRSTYWTINKTEGSFAFIRDYIKNAETGRNCKSILIASAEQGEGTKFVSSNLALTYAVEEDSAVLLQANLRDLSDLSNLSDLKPKDTDREVPGVWVYLEGRVEINDIINKTHTENLDVILPGKPGVTNPLKLLRSYRMAELIKLLGRKYELTVVYTAAATNFSDAAVLSPQTDGVLLVVEYDQVSAVKIKQAIGRMKGPGVNILGAVINKEKNIKRLGW